MRDSYLGVFGGICIIGLIIVLAIALSFGQTQSQQTTINNWAATNGYKVVSIEYPWFDHGPYWVVDEDDTIAKVTIRDKQEHVKVAYFRFRWTGHDVEWSH